MIKKLITLFLLICSVGIFAQEKLRIKGEISGIDKEAKVMLSGDVEEVEIIMNGDKFEVEIELKTAPSLVYLTAVNGSDYKYTTFFVGNETIELKGSIDDFPGNIRAQNSKYDDVRYEEFILNKDLNEQMRKLQEEAMTLGQEGMSRDSLYSIYMNKTEPLGKMTKVLNVMNENTFDFLMKNINTDYGRYIVKFSTEQFTTEQFKLLLGQVEPQFKNTKEIQYIQVLLDVKPLNVGDSYYDFKALDMEGKDLKFSDFFKGKYVLLDFSTFNCGYCQMAAPNTAKLEEDLKDKLSVVTYYVDNNLDQLKQYYALKGNKGNIIWSEDGTLSSTIAMYRQTVTPRYALFDPKGKLVENFEGMQDEGFGDKLQELMNK